jgi:hypothetical protein
MRSALHPLRWLPHALLALSLGVSGSRPTQSAEDGQRGRPVVIELFASQGCSSCTPALRTLAELSREARIIALTLPVDYWDYLGWKDSAAKPVFSLRQRSYATARGDRQVYTPQMVVNGAIACNAGRRADVEAALARASAAPTPASIDLQVREEGDWLVIMAGAGAGSADLWLLPVRRRLEVSILRGENQGRTLTYTNVVRDIRRVAAWSGVALTIRVPLTMALEGDADAYVVLLQDVPGGASPGEILGAAKSPRF